MLPAYSDTAPERAELDARKGTLLLEFGSNECGICRAATPLIAQSLTAHPDLPHLRIQDGKGRRLGRSFTVKLWPTLILMRDGEELGRVVRPQNVKELKALIAQTERHA